MALGASPRFSRRFTGEAPDASAWRLVFSDKAGVRRLMADFKKLTCAQIVIPQYNSAAPHPIKE